MDSSVSPGYGTREGTAHNGHFGCTCDHPLFLFNQFGDLERCSLRPGNVHSADDWKSVLKPVLVRYKGRKVRLYFRGDVAFASPEIYDDLEAEGVLYAIRLKAELAGTKTWVAGYANDVMAYIPSRRVLAEGGYEGASAMRYYGLPTVWAPEVENMIASEVHRQLGASP